MKNNFLKCGLTGWCMEIVFTSLVACHKKDYRLLGQTSIWMFPIYGMAALMCPFHKIIKDKPFWFRGIIYTIGIFLFEYTTGKILKRFRICPWDYSKAKSNIGGVIRLDFAPLWMAAGLLFEKIVLKKDKKSQ